MNSSLITKLLSMTLNMELHNTHTFVIAHNKICIKTNKVAKGRNTELPSGATRPVGSTVHTSAGTEIDTAAKSTTWCHSFWNKTRNAKGNSLSWDVLRGVLLHQVDVLCTCHSSSWWMTANVALMERLPLAWDGIF